MALLGSLLANFPISFTGGFLPAPLFGLMPVYFFGLMRPDLMPVGVASLHEERRGEHLGGDGGDDVLRVGHAPALVQRGRHRVGEDGLGAPAARQPSMRF